MAAPTADPLEVDELLAHVFSWLPLSDGLACSLVSKQWCHVVRDTPFKGTVVVREDIRPEVISLGGAVWRSAVRTLKIDLIGATTTSEKTKRLQTILKAFPSLESLSVLVVSGGRYGAPEKALDLSPLRSTPHLKALHLDTRFDYCIYPVTGISTLTELSGLRVLDYKETVVDWEEAKHLSQCTALERLVMAEQHYGLHAVPVHRLATFTTLTRLSSLDTHGHDLPADLSVWPLTEFCVKRPRDDFSASVQAIAPRLRALSLVCSKYDCAVAAVAMCTELTSLKVSFYDRDETDDPNATQLSFLAGCTKLKHVELGESKYVTDISALSNCTQLTALVLKSFYHVGDLTPLSQCPMLRTLYLENCFALENITALSTCVNMQTVCLKAVTCGRLPLDVAWMCNLPHLTLVNLHNKRLVTVVGVEQVKEYVLGKRGVFENMNGSKHEHDKDGTYRMEWMGPSEMEWPERFMFTRSRSILSRVYY